MLSLVQTAASGLAPDSHLESSCTLLPEDPSPTNIRKIQHAKDLVTTVRNTCRKHLLRFQQSAIAKVVSHHDGRIPAE